MTEEQKTRLEKYLAKTTVDLSVWEAVLCLDLEAESEADPAVPPTNGARIMRALGRFK